MADLTNLVNLPVIGTLTPGRISAAARAEILKDLELAVPPGKTVAALLILDKTGVKLGAAKKLNDVWTLDATAGIDWNGEVNGSIVLGATW